MKKYLLLIGLSLICNMANAAIYVGTWVSDITPGENDFNGTCLGGYGSPFSRCNSTEVLDKITVRALSIRDSKTKVETLMIVIDTVGIGDELSRNIKQKIIDWTNGAVTNEQIKTIATHTHAGPDLQGLWGGVSAEYREKLINKAALTGVLAKTFSFKSKVYAASTSAPVENRRGWDVVDESVNVLQFKSKKYNHNIATLVNMSAHPTIMDETNFGYSSGFVNSLRNDVQKATYSPVIFVNGIVGDAQPIAAERTYSESQLFGSAIARNVIHSLDEKEKIKGKLQMQSSSLNHELTNPNVLLAHAAGFLDIDLNQDNTIDTNFSYITLGEDVAAIGFPGEALSRLGLPIKNSLENKYKFFFGLYDDSYGYFIPSDEFLQIPGRTTEEGASIDINIGDRALEVVEELID